MSENREYKSDVFSMLMEEPERALEVYNALNETNYDDPSRVEMKRLDAGIALSVRNDAAFVIDFNLNLYEHQSTYNPNMPLRSLFYVAETLRVIVKDRDLYSRKKIEIPNPHFVVFYNGTENRPEYEEMKLSDSYVHKNEQPELEIICKVYNINMGKNKGMMSECKTLKEYMYFVDKVRYNESDKEENQTLEESIELAIQDCIKNEVLKDFLIKRGAEVKRNMTLDYTWERREVLIRAEERAEGRAEGIKEGRQALIRQNLDKGMPIEEIARFMGVSEEEIKQLI